MDLYCFSDCSVGHLLYNFTVLLIFASGYMSVSTSVDFMYC